MGKFFETAAEWALERALSPAYLRVAVVAGGGLLSAFFVVAERAQARGVTLGLVEYAKVGIPVTLLTLIWGLLVLLTIGR